jgi:glucan biosynthesis protein C
MVNDNQGKINIRYHSLDFLRALAMLLGLVVHAPLIYFAPEVAAAFGLKTVPSPELWVSLILAFITSWRMPMFFLLSGFFSILLIEKRGLPGFFNDRLFRIGVTFALFATLFDFYDGRFDGTLEHLWFLYYLLIFIIIFALSVHLNVVTKLLSKKFPIYSVFIVGCWLIISLPAGVIINGEYIMAPDKYTDIQIGSLIYYGSYYCAGILLYTHKSLLEKLNRIEIILALIPLALFTFVFHLDFLDLYVSYRARFNLSPVPVFLELLTIGLNTYFWCLLLMGLAGQFVKEGSKFLNWLVELSYPVYLLHLHPILFISVFLYVEGFNQFQSFIISILAGFSVCIALYYLLVKFTPLSWMLNGYKKSWLKVLI